MKKRILTGDRPTGKLHLGHYVGSLRNRVLLQDQYDCYFIIADLHTLTTKPQKEDILKLREYIYMMVLDHLACGIDPKKATFYLQSVIPAVYEMNLIFEMLISVNRLTGLPSIKEMARNAHLEGDNVPFGLLGYPVLQTADILMARAHLVPVGKDNEAHIELARDIALSAIWRAWLRRISVSDRARFWPSISTLILQTSVLLLSGWAQNCATVMSSGICWHAVAPRASAATAAKIFRDIHYPPSPARNMDQAGRAASEMTASLHADGASNAAVSR